MNINLMEYTHSSIHPSTPTQIHSIYILYIIRILKECGNEMYLPRNCLISPLFSVLLSSIIICMCTLSYISTNNINKFRIKLAKYIFFFIFICCLNVRYFLVFCPLKRLVICITKDNALHANCPIHPVLYRRFIYLICIYLYNF